MTTRVVVSLALVLSVGAPLSSAFAQVEHAQRVAIEVVTRRAQVRAALCEQQRNAATLQGDRQALRLPTSPPVGTGGPVPIPACPSR
ncbi:MAG: hypothetical protein H7Y60_17950 [Rhodospirillaceae bacterium]|nr:hypothetical protein [Rhodospirillales bacterium]